MISALWAMLIAISVVAYWLFCRSVSLRHRQTAANLIEEFMEDDSIGGVEKDNIYLCYMAARHWAFMPFMAVITPFAMLAMLLANGAPSFTPNSDRFTKAMDAVMMMYITRNPITGIACMVVTFASIAIATVIGLMLDRVKAMPSIGGVYGAIALKASKVDARHAH